MERYQRIAPWYDLLDLPFEYTRYRRIRPLLFDGLAGRILDAGVGTGRNMPFYPSGAEIVGIDLSPAMLAQAEGRRKLSQASVALRQMDVTALDLPPASFDAAVATFLFCVLADPLQVPALLELRRVVRPGGTIRLLEYVRPGSRLRRIGIAAWKPWVAWAYGASFGRHTASHISAAGLDLVDARFVVDDLIAVAHHPRPFRGRPTQSRDGSQGDAQSCDRIRSLMLGHFLTQPDWFTPVFWLLLLASCAIAVVAWRTDLAQRSVRAGALWILRVLVGSMWWQQTLWKIPPNFDGLRYWMEQEVDHASVKLLSAFVGDLVLPNLIVFGPLVYLVELVIGLSLLLGLFSRIGALLGALMAINLWLGLYSAPGEWPWTYMFLIIIQVVFVIDPPGRVLGADALLRRRTGPAPQSNARFSWVA